MSAPTSAASAARLLPLRGSDPAAARMGAKAAALARAMAAGHPVPDGVVVPPDFALDGDGRALEEAVAALGGGPFAVRSSAAHEDGLARSFAGQLDTALGVSPEGVVDAVARCRRSGEAVRAQSYGDPGAVSALVQRMVQADAAGVAFSADPRTGERAVVVIDATRGLGASLVAGAADAESWRCEGARAERARPGPTEVLDEGRALRVAALARAMEALFGAPQDIEWAFEGEALWLLQSRAITALPAAPVALDARPPDGDWERDDHRGVLSPLGWDWFQPYPVAMAEGMRALGVPVRAVRATRVAGHLYLQMDMPGGSVTPPRWVLWLASRLVPSMRKADRDAAAALDGETYLADIDRWERETRPALRAELDALFHPRPAALDDGALLARLRDALALTARGLGLHAALAAPSLLSMGKLQLFVEDHLGWRGDRALALLAGSSGSTTAEHRAIEALVRAHADEVRACGELPARWGPLHARCPGLAADLAAWLARNRLRVLHYDPKHPTLGERPALVLSIALAAAASLDAPTPAPPPSPAWDEARARLSPAAHAELERLVAHARRGYALRDENGVDAVSRPAGLLRWFVLELGRRLAPHLAAPEHAVYLYAHEHGPALRGEIADLAARVERRRGEESWALRQRPPKRYGAAPPAMTGLDAFPPGLRRVLRIFAWMAEIEAPPVPAEGEALRGVGVGERALTGVARVVDAPDDVAALRHGEVLVCRITSPEWSLALGRAGAIVSDEGALLSHPAIIAREFGIPAVLGAAGATRRLATGDRVRVDPVAGTVTRLGP